jgi:glycine/D-amino acid oxidase-like deaminating enzyme
MLPALEAYFDRPPRPWLDGGYYTKTQENRPLVGPLALDGAWVIGALSGFGLMAAPACGELLGKHIVGAKLPDYASWFLLERYEDPSYQELLKSWGRSGQL